MTTDDDTPSLREALDAALVGAGTASASAGDVTVEVDASDTDRLGVVVDAIRVRGGKNSLTERAARVASGVHPGGTALEPIEVDARLGGGHLRSPVDRRRRYFEANITESEIEVRRTQIGDDSTRQPSDLTVTRDQLGELIEQLEEAVR
jgi:hypothetical protein